MLFLCTIYSPFILYASVTGTVSDDSGNPVESATIIFTDENDSISVAFDITDELGYYEVQLGEPISVEEGALSDFSLGQNYPNPFNPTTIIPFSLDSPAFVTIRIYNALGQSVRTLTASHFSDGYHTIMWDGSDDNGNWAGTGMYIYRIESGMKTAARKMLLLEGGAVSTGSAPIAADSYKSSSLSAEKTTVSTTYRVEIFRDDIIPFLEPYDEYNVTLVDGNVYDFTVNYNANDPGGDISEPYAEQPETEPETLSGILQIIIGQTNAAKRAKKAFEIPDIPDMPDDPNIPDNPDIPVDPPDLTGQLIALAGSAPTLGNLLNQFGSMSVADLIALGLDQAVLASVVETAAGIALDANILTPEMLANLQPIIDAAIDSDTPVVFENPAFVEDFLAGIDSGDASVAGVASIASALGVGVGAQLCVVLPDSLDPCGSQIITLGASDVESIISLAEEAIEEIGEPDPPDTTAAKPAATGKIAVQSYTDVISDGYMPDDMRNTNPVQYRSYRIKPWESTRWKPDSDLNQWFRNDIDFYVQLVSNIEGTEKIVRVFTPNSGGFTCDAPRVHERLDRGYYQGATYIRIETIYDNSIGEKTCDWLTNTNWDTNPGSTTIMGPGSYGGANLNLWTTRTDISDSGNHEIEYYTKNGFINESNFTREVKFTHMDCHINRWRWNGQRASWRQAINRAYRPVDPKGTWVTSIYDLQTPTTYVYGQNSYGADLGLDSRVVDNWTDDWFEERPFQSDMIYIPTDLGQDGWRMHVGLVLKNTTRLNSQQRFRFKTTQYAMRTYRTWSITKGSETKCRSRKKVKWRTFMVDFSKVGP